MKFEIRITFKNVSPRIRDVIVVDQNQDFDKLKGRYRGQNVEMEFKTRNLESILKRMRSTKQTHLDISQDSKDER